MFENLKLIIKNAYTPYSNYNVACILVMHNNQEFIGVTYRLVNPGIMWTH